MPKKALRTPAAWQRRKTLTTLLAGGTILAIPALVMAAQTVGPNPKFTGPVSPLGPPITDFTITPTPNTLALGLIDSDTFADLVLPNSTGNSVTIKLGNGNGTFQAEASYTTGLMPNQAVIGSLNNTPVSGGTADGFNDIVTVNAGSGADSVSVLLANGNGGDFPTHVEYSTGINTTPTSVALGDLNEDGVLDIVTANSTAKTVSVFLGVLNGNGTFPANGTQLDTAPASAATNPRWVVLADVNNDNHLDIITANYGNSTVGVLLGTGLGTFAAAASYPLGGQAPASVAVADFNGDGYQDIVTVDPNLGKASVLKNNGASPGPAGSFGTAALVPVNFGAPSAVLAADVNDDGIQDIVLTDAALNRVYMLIGNLSGGFTSAGGRMVNFVQGSGAAYSSLYDINNDDKLDLITVNPTAGPPATVSVRINTSDLAVNFVGNTMYISPPARSTDSNFGSPTWGNTIRYVIHYNRPAPNTTPYWGMWAQRWPVTRTAPFDHLVVDMAVAQTKAGCESLASATPPGYGGTVVAATTPALPGGPTVCSRPAPLNEQTSGTSYNYRIYALGDLTAGWSAASAVTTFARP
ncbi:VCBS repeat-containing protein [uncultured Thiodictyon sp.]|uniref:FG-GAP repeat domain-containing protein n=1 Tax=uncultured Thiodictyon sp. TaxID=1846217 RepID=UPI002600055F|nr:VCBS repeat-containing protein [uncultured Thiodictyon sp.]